MNEARRAQGMRLIELHERRQYPVGQGFFHAGFIDGNGHGKPLRYVIDCGSMAKYAAERKARIREYVKSLRTKKSLDILFITHFHTDHVSGIEQLLTAVKVDTIVMPFLNVEDRLIAYARSLSEDRASAEAEFYQALIQSPGSTVSRFSPTNVIFVRPGNGDSGVPAEPEASPVAPPDLDLPLAEGRPGKWEVVGQGKVERYPTDAVDEGEHPGWMIVPDTMALRVPFLDGKWLLAPYVDRGLSKDRSKFFHALAKERRVSLPKLKLWLQDASNVKSLITTGAADLIAAYNAVTTDLNITSLCLYSGPAHPTPGRWPFYEYEVGPERLLVYQGGENRIAWLGTGDAALASGSRRAAFLRHYQRLLGNVGLLVLPHHGSEHNFHEELLRKIKPSICVASADRYSNWRHPSSHVVQSVCSNGSAIHVVTSRSASILREHVRIW